MTILGLTEMAQDSQQRTEHNDYLGPSLLSPDFLIPQVAMTPGCLHIQTHFADWIFDTELQVQIGVRWGHRNF